MLLKLLVYVFVIREENKPLAMLLATKYSICKHVTHDDNPIVQSFDSQMTTASEGLLS
jgi:hypothetical protein